MPATRSSARNAGDTSPATSPSAGSKRKADTSPATSPAGKTKKQKAPKQQKTIEETLPDADTNASNEVKDAPPDAEMKDAEPEKDGDSKAQTNGDATTQSSVSKTETSASAGAQSEKKDESDAGKDDKSTEPATNGDVKKDGSVTSKDDDTTQAAKNGDVKNDKPSQPDMNGDNQTAEQTTKPNSATESTGDATKSDAAKSDPKDTDTAKQESSTAKSNQDDAVEESSQREKATPSSILEKGIIYFFFRGRVGITDPSEVDDLARSFIVLRPLSRGAKLSDGVIADQGNNRVLALPKKVLPKGPNDRFMIFVDKAKASLEDLKKEFLSGSSYDTQTAGPRHVPAATPIGEGVYAITTTGRENHLAYRLTIPKELSEVQKDIGLEEKGSFVVSVKNPQHKGPAVAQLPKDPEFSQEILDEFRTLRWGPLQPKHLDYENCQFLVIGHKDHSFAKATETDDNKADPKEEIEKLGEEDERRVEHLEGDDTVFEDLDVDAKDYPSVQTTW